MEGEWNQQSQAFKGELSLNISTLRRKVATGGAFQHPARLGEGDVHNGGRLEDFESLSEKEARLTNECELLRDENSRLRGLLNQQTTKTEAYRSDSRSAFETSNQTFSATPDATVASVAVPARAAPKLSSPEKISLFRTLFRGREDIFVVSWEAGAEFLLVSRGGI